MKSSFSSITQSHHDNVVRLPDRKTPFETGVIAAEKLYHMGETFRSAYPWAVVESLGYSDPSAWLRGFRDGFRALADKMEVAS